MKPIFVGLLTILVTFFKSSFPSFTMIAQWVWWLSREWYIDLSSQRSIHLHRTSPDQSTHESEYCMKQVFFFFQGSFSCDVKWPLVVCGRQRCGYERRELTHALCNVNPFALRPSITLMKMTELKSVWLFNATWIPLQPAEKPWCRTIFTTYTVSLLVLSVHYFLNEHSALFTRALEITFWVFSF